MIEKNACVTDPINFCLIIQILAKVTNMPITVEGCLITCLGQHNFGDGLKDGYFA